MTSLVHCEKCNYEGYINTNAVSQEICPGCFAQGSLRIGARIVKAKGEHQ